MASLYSENKSIDINVNGVRYSEPCVRLMFAFVINWLSRPLVFTSAWSASQADLFEDGWAEMNQHIHQRPITSLAIRVALTDAVMLHFFGTQTQNDQRWLGI